MSISPPVTKEPKSPLISYENGVTRIHIPKGVTISEPIEVETDDNLEIVVEENAKVTIKIITRNKSNITQQITSRIIGEGGESNIDWVVHGKGNESYNLSAKNIFDAKNGKGEINIRGVAEERTHMKIDGMIEIGKSGSGTDAYLTEKILMLDHTAKVDAVPALEIKTNDVKASHSATVTKINEEDLFYFASRGISKEVARKMFIEGFLGEIAGKIDRQDVQYSR
jgi:Fe-S cluster assembly scaffold protein SufB